MPKLEFRKPMLAKEYEDYQDEVEFPCYAQPKLDGIRCVTDGRRFWSRNKKLFPDTNMEHLKVPALPYLVDGELMVMNSEFEDIVSAVKRDKGVKDEAERMAKHLKFCVFDIMTDDDFRYRNANIKDLIASARMFGAQWRQVQTVKVDNAMHLKQLSRGFLRRGHEGIMIRRADGLYEHKRSTNLLKWKPLHSNEFEIVGYKEAKGKDKGTPVFICRVGRPQDNMTFSVRPKGTMKQRRQMWRDRKSLLGGMLTVEYQYLMKSGKPRHPRAIVLRDYE